jgi:hypothetical protein
MAKKSSTSFFGGMTNRGPGGRGVDGPNTLPDPNLEIGMNFPLWKRDRAGFGTSDDMVTGGKTAAFGSLAGSEVGENYQEPMGEDRAPVTYVRSSAMKLMDHPGEMASGGADSAMGSMTTGQGKTVPVAPQNYTTISSKKDM